MVCQALFGSEDDVVATTDEDFVLCCVFTT